MEVPKNKDYTFIMINPAGKKQRSTISLPNDDAFLKFLTNTNLSAPPGWLAIREQDDTP